MKFQNLLSWTSWGRIRPCWKNSCLMLREQRPLPPPPQLSCNSCTAGSLTQVSEVVGGHHAGPQHHPVECHSHHLAGVVHNVLHALQTSCQQKRGNHSPGLLLSQVHVAPGCACIDVYEVRIAAILAVVDLLMKHGLPSLISQEELPCDSQQLFQQ